MAVAGPRSGGVFLRRLLGRLRGWFVRPRPAGEDAPAREPLPERGSALLAALAEARRKLAVGPAVRPVLALADAAESGGARGGPRLSSRAVIPPRTTPRFLLAVDDAGEFLVVVGERVTLGHLRARDVDLPFLADVAARHARLELVEDFHAGARWRIAPESGASVHVNGRAVVEPGTLLADGDEVRLAANLAFRFVARERGSSSARLEFGGGQECLGAPRVLLLAPGSGGRARIGAGAARLLSLHDLEHEIELSAERTAGAASVSVRCTAGLAAVSPAASEPEIRLALPLALSVTRTARARGPKKPPFALIFRPADAPLEG